MEIRIEDSAPKHIKQLRSACSELHHLQDAHVQYLTKKHSAKDAFSDSETVFIRAGITLLCAAWEAYVEDLARNGVHFLMENCKSCNDLPLGVRKNIAKEVKQDKNELSPWTLAGDDWRKVVKSRFETAIAREANLLNTPKASKVKTVFGDMLDIDDITQCWQWEFFECDDVRAIIDSLVEIRGSFAHGRPHSYPGHTLLLFYFESIVTQCAFLMNNHVRDRLLAITGRDPWAIVRLNFNWTQFGVLVEPEKEAPAR